MQTSTGETLQEENESDNINVTQWSCIFIKLNV